MKWQRKKEDVVYQAQEDLTKAEQLKSKQCYKLLLVLIKYAPIVFAKLDIVYVRTLTIVELFLHF